MGTELLDIIERLARASMAADANDPVSMTEIHSLLEEIKSASKANSASPGEAALHHRVETTRTLVESIILREVEDGAAAVKNMCAAVAEIQQAITGALEDKTPSVSGSETARKHPAAAGFVEPAETNAVLKEEDLPLVAEFIAEAATHLETAEAELLKLEANPEEGESINAVFRAFHTIKGVAGFLGLRDIGALAHATENLLDLGRKGSVAIANGTFEIVLEACDAMKTLLKTLDAAAKSRSVIPQDASQAHLIERLHIAAGNTQAATSTTHESTPRAMIASASPKQVAAAATSIQPSRNPAIPATQAKTVPAAGSRAPQSSTSAPAEATIKIATDRLDRLINEVGELVIAHSMSNQDMLRIASSDQRLLRNMAHLGKITRELQDLAMAMRMIPIQGVFQKMNRLVRDLARKAGKEIELVLVGAETELDRNVVEAISDPLVHMVRNAADHGIELPEDRVKSGKARMGRLELKAYHQAGNIVIEISDDGKGLNKARILKKAREAGIVGEGQELSEAEIFRLIFHAGLSTAEKITDVSGRGVGMDVVRKNVEMLRGRIDIQSVEGHGSTFTIRLPLTLAVIDGMIVQVGQEKFILPITSIEQSLRPAPGQLTTVRSRDELCLIRGKLLPIIRLHRLFNLKPQNEDPTKGLVVIVHDNERRCCLLIDALLGQQQVVIKSLGKLLQEVPGTSGGAIMGDGCVSLILDVPGLINLAATH